MYLKLSVWHHTKVPMVLRLRASLDEMFDMPSHCLEDMNLSRCPDEPQYEHRNDHRPTDDRGQYRCCCRLEDVVQK